MTRKIFLQQVTITIFLSVPGCKSEAPVPSPLDAEAGAAQAELRQLAGLEETLLAGGPQWPNAYRTLVAEGMPGWRIICAHELNVRKETDHLRWFIDLGGLPREQVDAFGTFMDEQVNIKLEDEQWTMAYVQAFDHGYHRSVLWLPEWIKDLRACYDDPPSARFAIAHLTDMTGRNFDFPWHGPKEKQQEAIKRWLAFWEEHKNDEEFQYGH